MITLNSSHEEDAQTQHGHQQGILLFEQMPNRELVSFFILCQVLRAVYLTRKMGGGHTESVSMSCIFHI